MQLDNSHRSDFHSGVIVLAWPSLELIWVQLEKMHTHVPIGSRYSKQLIFFKLDFDLTIKEVMCGSSIFLGNQALWSILNNSTHLCSVLALHTLLLLVASFNLWQTNAQWQTSAWSRIGLIKISSRISVGRSRRPTDLPSILDRPEKDVSPDWPFLLRWNGHSTWETPANRERVDFIVKEEQHTSYKIILQARIVTWNYECYLVSSGLQTYTSATFHPQILYILFSLTL